MSDFVLLEKALCLSVLEVAALTDGKVIAAISKVPIQRHWNFLLYPCKFPITSLPDNQQYRSHILPSHLTSTQEATSEVIEVWAQCQCTLHNKVEQLEFLSRSTIWTKAALQEFWNERENIILAVLQVYQLPQPIPVPENTITPDKYGKFVGLPILGLSEYQINPLKVTQISPVLDQSVFNQRKEQLEKRELSPYPELEQLYGEISQLPNNPAAKQLEQEIRTFLNWKQEDNKSYQKDRDLDWITRITEVGNSSNGYEFEKLVRKSLIKLGFSNSSDDPKTSLNPDSTGGAGGIDVYCQEPFPLVGECKASKNENVPNSVSAQLIHLGNTHLGKARFEESVKVIFAGALTSPAEKAAIEHQINVMRPETLQRLLELKAQYPGAIDLLELKRCLERSPFGEESDVKVNHYIEQILQELQLRANLVQAVKQLTQPGKHQLEVTEIRSCYNFMFFGINNQSAWLPDEIIYEWLIELSSPVAGYLGRIHAESLNSDRFYFLRDLLLQESVFKQ